MNMMDWNTNGWEWHRKVWNGQDGLDIDRMVLMDRTDRNRQNGLEWLERFGSDKRFGINRTVWEVQDELNWIVWIRMDRMNENGYGCIGMVRMDWVGQNGLGWMGWIQQFGMVLNELECKL